jgi:hypothetical protein
MEEDIDDRKGYEWIIWWLCWLLNEYRIGNYYGAGSAFAGKRISITTVVDIVEKKGIKTHYRVLLLSMRIAEMVQTLSFARMPLWVNYYHRGE